MKSPKPDRLLHTTVLSLLLAATLGVSACSTEKEDNNAQSGDAIGVNQSGETDASLQSGAPLPENDSAIDAGEDAGTSAAGMSNSDGMNTADSSGAADTSGDSMTDNNTDINNTNNTNDSTSENPNLDQTSPDGVQ